MKVSPQQFKQIRAKYEAKLYQLLDEIDESKYNSGIYKESFKNMSDKEFIDFMKEMIRKDDLNFSMDVKQLQDPTKPGAISLSKIDKVANKWGHSLYEYVLMPFRNPKGEPMCTLTPIPILYVPIKRFFQQMLQHKNSISNDNSKINPLTGQVVEDDKTASTTNVQTYALTITNQRNALKEFLGPRADDQVSKQQMITTIEQTGDVSLSDLDIQTHNKQSVKTVEVFCKAAGLDVKFAGNDLEIDLSGLDNYEEE